MDTFTITFIGGGNMARSLIGGLIADGTRVERIRVSDPSAEQRSQLQGLFGIATFADNHDAIAGADVIVLAVKPQIMQAVATGLAPALSGVKPLLLSIAAGIRSTDLHRWLGGHVALVRTMPNTPALVRSGATGLFARKDVSREQRDLAETILRAVGLTLWVDNEDLIDSVTAVSGSGPAYFFLIMEAMEEAAIQLGLDEESARLLTLETALGAARMALESDVGPATLRQRVTSPGGTTERAIGEMQEADIKGIFAKALTAARDRSRELSDLLGSD
ncbi:MAG TPA: pyrroline-5-carboxylate reductase [Chromatiales bacterium]|nr:pyrroline-5-carboxylate reductase [Chromatiales bacterium]